MTLLIWEKFWQILHFGSLSSVSSSGVGEDLGGKLKNVLYPLAMHASLTRCCNSSNIRPAPVCAFCASVVGDTHFTSSGEHCSMIFAFSIVSMLSYRYFFCGGVSGFWFTFVENFIPGGMSR